MNEHAFDSLEAARRAAAAMEAPFPEPPVVVVTAEAQEAPRDLEAELRAVLEHDEAIRDAIHADAWTIVARLHERLGRPILFRPHAARTAVAISRLLLAEIEAASRIDEDPAFQPMSEAEAKAELEKSKRTAPAFKAIAAGMSR
jgi:hypothetical protein